MKRVDELELAPPPLGKSYANGVTGTAKEIFLLVTLELTELKVDKDLADPKDTAWAVTFNLVDRKGDKFEQEGIVLKEKFHPGAMNIWIPGASGSPTTSLTTTIVFDVPADATGLKIKAVDTMLGDCEIDLIP